MLSLVFNPYLSERQFLAENVDLLYFYSKDLNNNLRANFKTIGFLLLKFHFSCAKTI